MGLTIRDTIVFVLLSCVMWHLGDTQNCDDGYYNVQGACYLCRPACVTCTGYNQCTECIPGRYDPGCWSSCRENCITCTAYWECTTCEAGHWGGSCQSSCDTNCRNQTCNKDNGVCDYGCIDNWYPDGRACKSCPACSACPDSGDCKTVCCGCQVTNCNTCSPDSDTTCSECKDGFYLNSGSCNPCNANCQDGKCDKTNGHCTNGCVNGYTGPDCTGACPSTCRACDQTFLNQCTSCISGYYGQSCNSQCSANCNLYNGDRVCNKDNGGCSSGCVDGWSGSTCDEMCPSNCASCDRNNRNTCYTCKSGFYGNSCEHDCNPNCGENNGQLQCYKGSGSCIYPCKTGWSGLTCDERCPSNCALCDRYDKDTCTECSPGYYGNSCEQECSPNCGEFDGQVVCVKSSGYCTFPCKTGWSGSMCRDPCNTNCISCESWSVTHCDLCIPGFYGQSCDRNCSRQCKEINGTSECNKDNGNCDSGCLEGWTGSMCTDICPKYCTSCDQQNRDNCHACDPGYFGQSCGSRCNEHCGEEDGTKECNKGNGSCAANCETGYQGAWCNDTCGEGCKGGCGRYTGACPECQPERYGPFCQLTCNSTCYDPGNGANVCDKQSGQCLFDASTQERQKEKDDSAAVIGGSVGAVVVVLMIVAAVVILLIVMRRRRGKPSERPEDETGQSNLDAVYSVPLTSNVISSHDNGGPTDAVHSVPQKMKVDDSSETIVLPTLRKSKQELVKTPPTDGQATAGVYSNVGFTKDGQTKPDIENTEVELEEIDDVDAVDVGNTEEPESPTGDNYYNIDGLTRSRIEIAKLREHVNSKSMEDFVKEFLRLPKDLIRPHQEAITAVNGAKNRYCGIYPYDDNRVKLFGNGGDYINASYIEGYGDTPKTYIASLGPTDKFMKGYVDIWRMVVQERVYKIVMLTNFLEEAKVKCDKYWPDMGQILSYGDVTVQCVNVDTFADFNVTKLSVTKGSRTSTIHHFHYTAWPDRGTPENVASIVEFHDSVEHVRKTTEGPMLVHCSAGIGRTGTYIALDILTKEGRADSHVDVYGCVLGLRGQRVSMVQNKDQYIYLHHALVHALTNNSGQIEGNEFGTVTETTLQEQFKLLDGAHRQNSSPEKEAVQKNKKEKYKNRKGADIPGDAHRPRLYRYNQNSKSDYINAIYANSFEKKNRFIIAQTPMAKTVDDFVGLVLQEDCSCIVSLDPIKHTKTKDVGYFIPEDGNELSIGKFKLKAEHRETTSPYKLCRLNVQIAGTENSKTVSHYQYTDWPDDSLVPTSTQSFLNFVKEIDRRSREPNDDGEQGPVLIHCLYGGDRSCLFPVVASLLEKINAEQQASVVNLVTQVRTRRRGAIPNVEQLTFCYAIAALFVENNSVYSNLQ